jgi:hypothetical protein
VIHSLEEPRGFQFYLRTKRYDQIEISFG